MDKSQAQAVAQAALQPHLEAQAQMRRKREQEALVLAGKRKVAWLALIGFAVGAAAAHYSGHRFTMGGLWGGLGAAAAGWLWLGWRSRQRAS